MVESPSERLYNLAEDIGETRDVSAEHPEILKELRAAYQAWASTLQDPAWPAD